MTKTITLSDKQYDALAIIHNHLADEEQSYEHASAEDKEYHIWQYVLQLRELLQNPGKAEVTAIANIQGGVLQDVYCPNPDIAFDYMLIDYDNEEAGIDGYEELVRSLECADEEESKYGYQPSVRETLDEKRATLAELRQEQAEAEARKTDLDELPDYVAGRVGDLCGMDTETLEHALSILKDEHRRRDNATVHFNIWHLEDVKSRRPDLSDDQCREVLTALEHRHDAEIGINWDVIDAIADDLFSEPENIYELREKYEAE